VVCLVNACASSGRDGPARQERVWPVYLGQSSRAGGADTLTSDPQPVWSHSVARGISGAPALAEDVVALSLVDNRVALLDRATGALIWTRRLAGPLGAGPLIAADRLFVAEQQVGGRVWAIRLLNGTTIWSARAGDVSAPLVLADSSLYLANSEGLVVRASAGTGIARWHSHVGGAVRTTPLVVPAGLVVATQMDSLFLLDVQSGAVRVRRGTRGTVLAAPAWSDSTIVVGTTAGRLEGLNAATLQTRWSLDLGDAIVGNVALRDGRAYALTGRGTLVIVPLERPAEARRVAVGIIARAGPTPAAQGIFLGGVRGEIVLVDSLGVHKWDARILAPVAEAVLVDARTLIAVSVRGDVVMFR
jgi:outer membrane protein assembly factor BamB